MFSNSTYSNTLFGSRDETYLGKHVSKLICLKLAEFVTLAFIAFSEIDINIIRINICKMKNALKRTNICLKRQRETVVFDGYEWTDSKGTICKGLAQDEIPIAQYLNIVELLINLST